jgi:hypothetical protein
MQTSRLAVDAMAALADAASAEAEFTREFPAFAKLVGITPAMMEKLPIPTVLMLVNMRMFKLLSSKIRELDARTAVIPIKDTVQ